MKLGDLIKGLPIELIRGEGGAEVDEIVYDSRKAGPGALFAALPGANVAGAGGHMYIRDAYDRGCRMFLVQDMPEGAMSGAGDFAELRTQDTRRALALMSRRFFGYPERRLKVVAVTGTKGKTTISYMLRSIFEAAGKKVALIGSNGVIYEGFYKKLLNTTPESYLIHGFLKEMADAGIEYCFIEATSQGFKLHRTEGIEFDAALFTNISPDHISDTEHKDFNQYLECKKRVFDQTRTCYVNRDAEFFDDIVADTPEGLVRAFGFSREDGGRARDGDGFPLNYTARDVRPVRDDGRLTVEFLCAAPGWQLDMKVGMPGFFNVENALGAICIADHFGIGQGAIAQGLATVSCEGRMEFVDVPAPYLVLIDFAHNSLSMKALIDTARSYNPNRLLFVFGLEGERTAVRNADCGEALGREADYIILSDASPRTADPEWILSDIAAGIERGGGAGKYEIIRDRHVSIPKILDMAEPGDLVILLGKGNVLYEEVHGELTPMDEREIIRDYFAALDGGS